MEALVHHFLNGMKNPKQSPGRNFANSVNNVPIAFCSFCCERRNAPPKVEIFRSGGKNGKSLRHLATCEKLKDIFVPWSTVLTDPLTIMLTPAGSQKDAPKKE